MITDEALYPINHAWRVHWAADSSGLMHLSIIDARFNDESAPGESIAVVNTHPLIRDGDALLYDNFRRFLESPRQEGPRRFFASPLSHPRDRISITITRHPCMFVCNAENSPLSRRLIQTIRPELFSSSQIQRCRAKECAYSVWKGIFMSTLDR